MWKHIPDYNGFGPEDNHSDIFQTSSAFSYPCEGMTFSQNYDTVYYTRIPKREKKEKIFMAKYNLR